MTWGLNRVELAEVVGPGQYIWFRFNVTAPQTPGEYQFSWRMVQEGREWFGEIPPYTPIVVTGVSGNTPPAIGLTSPVNNATYTDPATILISANAIDSDGSVSQVEFYEGGNYLGVDTNGADGWSLTWTNAPPGSYSLSATATDNAKAAATSPAVNISFFSDIGGVYAYSHQRLYRAYNANITNNFYTVDKEQLSIAINQHGYQDMGYVAYVPSTSDGAAIPFY